MEGENNMHKIPHIIWGRTPQTYKKIHLLKKNGMEEIYVRDPNQSQKVKAENEVVYLSPEGVDSLFKPGSETVHLIFVPLRTERKK